MIAVRLEDGSTVYAFGGSSVAARNAHGLPDSYWQRQAERALRETGDPHAALSALPGARVIHAGALPATTAPSAAALQISTTSPISTTNPHAARPNRRRSKRS